MRCGAEEKSEENRKTVCIWSDAAELVLSSRIPDPRSGAGECSGRRACAAVQQPCGHERSGDAGYRAKAAGILYGARRSFFRNGFIGGLLRRLGAFPVRRGTGGTDALEEAYTLLEEDAIVGVFIEGHRSKTGELQSRKQAPRCCVTAPKRRWFRCASQRRTASCPGPSTERSFSLENLSLLNACRFLTTPACSSEGPAVPSWVKSPRCGKNP